jgi:hypothetical protein
MKRLFVLLLALAVFFPAPALARKSVSVRGYYRKDGTYVRPHTRSAPGSGGSYGGASYLYSPPDYTPSSEYRSDYRSQARTQSRSYVSERDRTERERREQERQELERQERERQEQEERTRLEQERLAQLERERLARIEEERRVQELRKLDDRDRLAASKFRIAVKFYCQGNLPVAQKWVQDLAGEYPDTPTGAEAQQILAESFLLAMQSRVEEGRRVNSSLMMEGLEFREWQDVTGAYKVIAAFVAQIDGVVILVKQNGDPINVPMEKLCQADQDWANSQK